MTCYRAYPYCSTILAAAASVVGLLPPSWHTIGCCSGGNHSHLRLRHHQQGKL